MRPVPAVLLRRSLVWRPPTPPVRVRERPVRYEDEGSEREARGAVAVGDAAWWSASLRAPIVSSAGRELPVRLRLVRHGPGAGGGPDAIDVELLMSAGEVAAVVALLAGVAAQAARDVVLPAWAAGGLSAPPPPP